MMYGASLNSKNNVSIVDMHTTQLNKTQNICLAPPWGRLFYYKILLKMLMLTPGGNIKNIFKKQNMKDFKAYILFLNLFIAKIK